MMTPDKTSKTNKPIIITPLIITPLVITPLIIIRAHVLQKCKTM